MCVTHKMQDLLKGDASSQTESGIGAPRRRYDGIDVLCKWAQPEPWKRLSSRFCRNLDFQGQRLHAGCGDEGHRITVDLNLNTVLNSRTSMVK